MQLCEHPFCGKPVETPGRRTHYGCDLKVKGVQVLPSATPTRTSNRPQSVRPMQQPSWEKGIAGETRPDGSFMPYLNEHREEMGVHEFANRRRDVEGAVKRLKSDPNVFARERATGVAEVQPYADVPSS